MFGYLLGTGLDDWDPPRRPKNWIDTKLVPMDDRSWYRIEGRRIKEGTIVREPGDDGNWKLEATVIFRSTRKIVIAEKKVERYGHLYDPSKARGVTIVVRFDELNSKSTKRKQEVPVSLSFPGVDGHAINVGFYDPVDPWPHSGQKDRGSQSLADYYR